MDEIAFNLRALPVSSAIFAITILVSLLAFYNEDLYARSMLNPLRVAKGEQLYTLITSGFIHKDLMHLGFNMFTFYLFAFGAFSLEGHLGHWQFALLYMVSMVLSDLPTVYKHRENFWYRSLGASGAISAMVFSFIIFKPWEDLYLIFLPQIGIPAIVFGILYLIYCAYAAKKEIGGINHDAHFYGAICGVIITIIIKPESVHDFFSAIAQKFGG